MSLNEIEWEWVQMVYERLFRGMIHQVDRRTAKPQVLTGWITVGVKANGGGAMTGRPTPRRFPGAMYYLRSRKRSPGAGKPNELC
jgi:hypothetical protein